MEKSPLEKSESKTKSKSKIEVVKMKKPPVESVDEEDKITKSKRPISKRADISRRYYVKKTLLNGKVPKNANLESIKNDKLLKLNSIIDKLKNNKSKPIEEDDEADNEEEESNYDDEEDSNYEDEETESQTEDDDELDTCSNDDLMEKLDSIIELIMILAMKQNAKYEEQPKKQQQQQQQARPQPRVLFLN